MSYADDPNILLHVGRLVPANVREDIKDRAAFPKSGFVAESIETTLEARGKLYGEFSSHATITQALKEIMQASPRWGVLSPSAKEALDMIQHKIGRILNGDPTYIDSWHDIIGYARLEEERLQKFLR